jgi:hypothetical protein
MTENTNENSLSNKINKNGITPFMFFKLALGVIVSSFIIAFWASETESCLRIWLWVLAIIIALLGIIAAAVSTVMLVIIGYDSYIESKRNGSS